MEMTSKGGLKCEIKPMHQPFTLVLTRHRTAESFSHDLGVLRSLFEWAANKNIETTIAFDRDASDPDQFQQAEIDAIDLVTSMPLPGIVNENVIMLATLAAEQIVTKRMASPDLLVDDEEHWKMVDGDFQEGWSAEFSDGQWTLNARVDPSQFILGVSKDTKQWRFVFSNEEVVCMEGNESPDKTDARVAGDIILKICRNAVKRELYIQGTGKNVLAHLMRDSTNM